MSSIAYKFVNEKSNSFLEIKILNELGGSYVPISVKYRVDDVYSEQQVIDWTNIDPSGNILSIAISPSTNALIKQTNKSELRKVTVVVDEDLPSESTEDFVYEVRGKDFYS